MDASSQEPEIITIGGHVDEINEVDTNEVSVLFHRGESGREEGDGEEQNEYIPWDYLPDLALAKIASFMSDWDKYQMSLVCKNWKRVILAAPRLWRHRIIRLGGNFRDRLHVNYAYILGRYLHRLHLSSRLRSIRHVRKCQRNFTAILAELYRQNVQLEELSLTDLKFHSHFRGIPGGHAREGIIRSARRFLGRQHKLRYLCLSYGGMTCEEGTTLLSAASEKSSQALRALEIEELFRPGEAIHRSPLFVEILPRFVNLKHLIMNYAALSDNLLHNLAQETNRKLEYLHVRCFPGESANHIVGTPAWRAFSSAMTRCKVEFTLLGIFRLSDIQRVLTPQMQLQILNVLGHDNDGTFQPDRMLRYVSRHLTNSIDMIEKVLVDVSQCYKKYGRGLIELIRDSPRLRHVEVRGRLRWHIIHDIFEFLEVNFVRHGVCPTLTTLRMLVNSTPTKTCEEEAFVMEEYRPVFSRFDVVYELVIEPVFLRLPF